MEKIIAKDFYVTNPDKFKVFREWGEVDRKITKFQNYANLKVFKFLFGDEEGERLWKHFVIDCNRTFRIFRTYLTDNQFDDIMVNIYYSENMYSIS